MSENSLIIFTKASQMLAEANTIQKAKELKDLALTAQDWAKRKNMGSEAIKYAHSYAIQAEIRLGELLKETERQKPGMYRKKTVPSGNALPLTLTELGLTKKDSSRAQQLANLPIEKQEAIVRGEISRIEAKREVKRDEVERRIQKIPEGKYRVIYADPPWKYGDTRDTLSSATGATAHYPTMSIDELCALSIKELADENAVLFLWVTSPILPECFDVIRSWGFAYKASFVWDKVKHNLGHYNSVRHEFLLVCTKGSCLPDIPKLFDSVVSIERTEHSKKPAIFREMIDKIYPYGNRIELFARGECPSGWETWGNERSV